MEPATKPSTITAAKTPAARDRRQGNRHRLDLPATIVAEQASDVAATPVAVTVTHFSVNGLAFRTAVPVVVGAVYLVSCFDTLLPNNLRVRVVTRRDLPGGSFEVGTEVV
jgi:hypothetical protein